MCAIFGMGFMNGHKVHNNTIVKDMITRLAVENQPRGRDASGLALTSPGHIKVIKKDLPAERFIKLPEYKRTLEAHVSMSPMSIDRHEQRKPENLYSILGHCRYQTKGTYRVNENNHPIVRKDIVGVHNGSIRNDDYLFNAYSMHRNAEVDSEAIFALIEYFTKGDNNPPIHKAVRAATSRLEGTMACAFVHKMHPHIVWLFRRNGPCDIVIYTDCGLVVWSSAYNYIQRALKPHEDFIGIGERVEMPKDSGLAIDLHRNLSYSFDIYNYTNSSRGTL